MAYRLDPYSMQLFCIVAEARSFSRAATHAHLDATSLGRRIKGLEEGLGILLFVRSPQGLKLTQAGQRLLHHAREINRKLDDVAADMAAGSDDIHGTVRIAANPSSMLAVIPELLADMQRTHPAISLQLIEASTPEVVRLCATGGTDIGVGTDYRGGTGIHRRRLLSDRLVLVVDRQHSLAKPGPIAFRDALAWPHVVKLGGALDHVLFRQAKVLQREVQLAVVVQSYDVTFRMVEAGVGVAIVPALALRGIPNDRRFVVRPLEDYWVERALWLYSRWHAPPDPALATVVEMLERKSAAA
jgi:DNA-binding transcriptional LysR family regulator